MVSVVDFILHFALFSERFQLFMALAASIFEPILARLPTAATLPLLQQ